MGRKMKLIILLLPIIFAVNLISFSVAGQDGLPKWEEGDTWDYTISSSFGDMNLSQIVDGVETIFVNGTEFEVYSVTSEMQLSWSGLDISYPSTYYYRISDLALVKTEMTINVYGISAENHATYNPPKREFDFPLEVGKTWSETSNSITYSERDGIITNYNEYEETFSYRVAEMETVTVPAGTFECYRILCEDESGDETVTWYSPEVKNFVKQSSEDPWESSGTELTSYDVVLPEEESEGFGTASLFKMPYLLFLMIIPIIVIILIVTLVTRAREKKDAKVQSQDTANYMVPGAAAPHSETAAPPKQFMPLGAQSNPVSQSSSPLQNQAPAPLEQQPPPPPPPPPPVKNPCPTCRNELSLIHKYNRWYCQTCDKYW